MIVLNYANPLIAIASSKFFLPLNIPARICLDQHHINETWHKWKIAYECISSITGWCNVMNPTRVRIVGILLLPLNISIRIGLNQPTFSRVITKSVAIEGSARNEASVDGSIAQCVEVVFLSTAIFFTPE